MATLADAVIRDTQAHGAGVAARGINVESGARVDATRLLVSGNRDLGASVSGIGAELTMTGAVIRDTTAPAPRSASSAGVVVSGGGTFTATRLLVANNRELGIFLAEAICGVMVGPVVGHPEATSLDLQAGVVSEAEIGACVQVSGYDLGRLTAEVRYHDNTTNLDSPMLAVPEVGAFEF